MPQTHNLLPHSHLHDALQTYNKKRPRAVASAVPPPLLPTGHSSSDAPELKHNVRMLASGMGISTRCNDNNVVLVRSIKAAKAKAA